MQWPQNYEIRRLGKALGKTGSAPVQGVGKHDKIKLFLGWADLARTHGTVPASDDCTGSCSRLGGNCQLTASCNFRRALSKRPAGSAATLTPLTFAISQHSRLGFSQQLFLARYSRPQRYHPSEFHRPQDIKLLTTHRRRSGCCERYGLLHLEKASGTRTTLCNHTVLAVSLSSDIELLLCTVSSSLGRMPLRAFKYYRVLSELRAALCRPEVSAVSLRKSREQPLAGTHHRERELAHVPNTRKTVRSTVRARERNQA